MTDLLADALVDLGLRRDSGGLAQSSDGGLTGEFDFKGVVLVSPRALQQQVRGSHEGLLARWLSDKQILRIRSAPGFVGDTTQRDPRLADRTTFDPQTSRDGHQSEGIGQAVAQLQVGVVRPELLCRGRQLDAGDDLIPSQGGVDLRPVTWEAMVVGQGDRSRSARANYVDDRLERGQRHGHVRRVRRDAMLALAENGVDAVDPRDGGATGAGLTLVAGGLRVVEVVAPGALVEVAPRGGGVAQLRRGAGQDRAGQERIALLDQVIVATAVLGTRAPMR